MKVIQELTLGDTTYLFTDNPEEDIKILIEKYEDEDRDYYMGYEIPELTKFTFLGKDYPAISFWHDNEDPREIEFLTSIIKDIKDN